MRTHLEKIYSDYISADFADRLYLYLQYPELRNDFFEIEREATKQEMGGVPGRKAPRPQSKILGGPRTGSEPGRRRSAERDWRS
jgi:hypothetical protein